MAKILDVINRVRQKQDWRRRFEEPSALLPHKPEMLYIGCIDARLDPIADIGIPKGKALIFRNIGALVPPEKINGKLNPEATSVGAALEFFLSDQLETEGGRKKQIAISGHTCCGGIAHACTHHYDVGQQEQGFLMRYLSMLTGAINRVFGGKADPKNETKMRQVEHESVRNSIKNLMEYKVVKDAIEAGTVEIHGWVIDTATQRIEELEKDKEGNFARDKESGNLTGNFIDMSDNRQANVGRA